MILRMLVPFLVMLIVPDVYIYGIYIRHSRSKLLKICWWLPTIVIGGIITAAFLLNVQHQAFMNPYFILMLCFSCPKIMFMLVSMLGKALGLKFSSAPKISDSIGIFLGACILAILGYGSIWGWKQLTLREVTIVSPDLPEAFDGYRVTMFTDMHIGTQAGKADYVERVAQFVQEQNGDVILFAGDLINGNPNEMEPSFIKSFSKLHAKDGVYAIMGNHDYCTYGKYASKAEEEAAVKELERLEREDLHWDLLLNENRFLHRGNDSIALLGVENDGRPPFPQLADLPKTLKGVPENCFKLLLSHDPTHWRRTIIPETDIQLMLAGHTHAAQFKVGGFTPASFTYQEADGLYQEGAQQLFVSAGLGEVMFPFRFGAWPEVVVITLRKN